MVSTVFMKHLFQLTTCVSCVCVCVYTGYLCESSLFLPVGDGHKARASPQAELEPRSLGLMLMENSGGSMKQRTFSENIFWASLLIRESVEWRVKRSAPSAHSRYFTNAFIDWYMEEDGWTYARSTWGIVLAGVYQGIRRNEVSDPEKGREAWFVSRRCWCSLRFTHMSKGRRDMGYPNPILSQMFQDQKHVIKITFAETKVSLALCGHIKSPEWSTVPKTMCSVQKPNFLISDSPQVWKACSERARNEIGLCNKGQEQVALIKL